MGRNILRHNFAASGRNKYYPNYARRDTGGWVRLHEFFEATEGSSNPKFTDGLWMAREYAEYHRALFRSEAYAILGGVIAGIAGSEGSRIAVLLATVDTGSVDRFWVPEEAGMRYCLFPVAMRICGGHSDGQQVFSKSIG